VTKEALAILVLAACGMAAGGLILAGNLVWQAMVNEVNAVTPDRPLNSGWPSRDAWNAWPVHARLFPQSPRRRLVVMFMACGILIGFSGLAFAWSLDLPR
jgi:hypothetical protein